MSAALLCMHRVRHRHTLPSMCRARSLTLRFKRATPHFPHSLTPQPSADVLPNVLHAQGQHGGSLDERFDSAIVAGHAGEPQGLLGGVGARAAGQLLGRATPPARAVW
eukprot:364759-Chlamydomonas_euryale.AAC.15